MKDGQLTVSSGTLETGDICEQPQTGLNQSFLNVATIVELKSSLALLYKKGHNFWKSVSTQKIEQSIS